MRALRGSTAIAAAVLGGFLLRDLASSHTGAAIAQAEVAQNTRHDRRTPVVDVFEKCRDAVVNISTARTIQVRSPFAGSIFDDIFDLPRQREQRVTSVGSGFIIHEDGYIVTNAHVVAQTADVRVNFADNTSEAADIVAVDPDHDLAVLRVRSNRTLPALKLAAGDDILVGETVVAIGNPLGLEHTVTAGIVSAINREIQFNPNVTYHDLIQTDTPINRGNSGGPLLNVNAELIGVNTAIRGDAQNIGFSIPVKHLWELLPAMLDLERRERVRIGFEVVGDDAEVTTVTPDSPAWRAGIRRGDRVVRFNGRPLHDSIDYYVRLLEQKPGGKMQLALQRGDKTVPAEVPLEPVPPPDGAALAHNLLGVRLVPISDRLRRRFEEQLELELPESIGLAIEAVERDSPADRTGLERGDLIVRLGRVPAPTTEDVGLFLEKLRPGDRTIVEVLRATNRGTQLLMGEIRLRAGS